MKKLLSIPALFLACAAIHTAASAQQPILHNFSSHNTAMSAYQPAFITPLIAADPRLVQYARFSVSHSYTSSGTETVSYGNSRGGGVIIGNRFELDWMPPAYIQHNSTAIDGTGDTSVVGKYRIASGNAHHGNFEVAGLLSHTFATGSHKNGAATDSFTPTLAAGKTFGKYDVISSLGGTLPTGKIAAQGRTVAWNVVSQAHLSRHVWVEAENNATFFFAGSHDGKMQNFLTPAAFYVIRRKEWAPTHPFLIVNAGMQIASSHFHTSNHNLIAETRLLF